MAVSIIFPGILLVFLKRELTIASFSFVGMVIVEGSHRDLPALQVVRDCSDKVYFVLDTSFFSLSSSFRFVSKSLLELLVNVLVYLLGEYSLPRLFVFWKVSSF